MATQHFKRNLLLNLYREEKTLLVCFLLPLKRAKNVWHLQPLSSIWRPPGLPACYPLSSVGDLGSIPSLGRTPGGGNGNPLQYSCLENPHNREACRATVQGIAKLPTQFNDFYLVTHSLLCGRVGLSVPSTSQRVALSLNMEAWTTLGSSLHRRNCNNLRFSVASTPQPVGKCSCSFLIRTLISIADMPRLRILVSHTFCYFYGKILGLILRFLSPFAGGYKSLLIHCERGTIVFKLSF